MNGAQDMGGVMGFGPVVAEKNEPVFHGRWEERVLAMTIAMLERLTPGELTGGNKVAATGTIEGDESVGEVGGVKQKTLAVKAAGAKLFLVPKSEVALARPHAGNMRVVGIANLDEALAALRQLGGDPLPPPRA